MTTSAPIMIFVRPIAHGNVGALARVMSNFGVKELRLVHEPRGEAAFDKESRPLDWGLACRGESVLNSLKVFPSLAAALEDVQWSVATTARNREKDSGYSRPIETFAAVLEKLKKDTPTWAIVIGPEDHGLSDEDLSLCNCLVTIETSPESPSINAAMAAGCFLYHWSLENFSPEKKNMLPSPDKDRATLGEIEKVSNYIFETLKLSEFFKYPDQEAVMARLRRIFQKEEMLSRGDILFVFEIFYQLRSKIQGHFDDRNFLK